MYDVAIIGAGVAGATVARELSFAQASTVVLEAGADVAWGCSRTNSAIIHGGYDPEPGTAKARFNVEGARMWPALAASLGVRYVANGSMVCAFTAEQDIAVRALVERGRENGVDHVRYVDAEEALALEPNLNPEVVGALVCESSGIIDPFMATQAALELAHANGVEVRFGARVQTAARDASGAWTLALPDGSTVTARYVVNAAGVGAFDLHNQVSAHKLASRPRAGEYVVLSRDTGSAFAHTMFQAPTRLGKGVLVSPTVEGNTIVGPDAIDVAGAQDTATTADGLSKVVVQARLTWPALPASQVINNFAGVRPTGADGDFVIGEPEDVPGFFDIVAFDSPGLTSAPAVARFIARDILERLGAAEKNDAERTLPRPFRFLEATPEERLAAAEKDPRAAHIVCRCERVTEKEIVDAIHSLGGVPTVQSVKRRCRATAGKCQGGFCEPAILSIIARETGMALETVAAKEPGVAAAPYGWRELAKQGPAARRDG
jgi:L-2-hydroxyglutarate oxidase LhgO